MTPCVQGLLPLPFNQATGKPFSPDARNTSMLTMGAMADSAYEYFLKMWLLTGKQVVMHTSQEPLKLVAALFASLICAFNLTIKPEVLRQSFEAIHMAV